MFKLKTIELVLSVLSFRKHLGKYLKKKKKKYFFEGEKRKENLKIKNNKKNLKWK